MDKIKIYIDGPKNEDWPKKDPVVNASELRAIEDAKKKHDAEVKAGEKL